MPVIRIRVAWRLSVGMSQPTRVGAHESRNLPMLPTQASAPVRLFNLTSYLLVEVGVQREILPLPGWSWDPPLSKT